jgi:hypothetical protein
VDAKIAPLKEDDRSLAKGHLEALAGMGMDSEGSEGVQTRAIVFWLANGEQEALITNMGKMN